MLEGKIKSRANGIGNAKMGVGRKVCNFKWGGKCGFLEKVPFEHNLGGEELCHADTGRTFHTEEIIRAKVLGKERTQSGSKEVCVAGIKGESGWR